VMNSSIILQIYVSHLYLRPRCGDYIGISWQHSVLIDNYIWYNRSYLVVKEFRQLTQYWSVSDIPTDRQKNERTDGIVMSASRFIFAYRHAIKVIVMGNVTDVMCCQRPYPCGKPGCGKRYTDPSSLRKHQKCHVSLASLYDVRSSRSYFTLRQL